MKKILFTSCILFLIVGCHHRIGMPAKTANTMQSSHPRVVGQLEGKVYFRFGDSEISPLQYPKLENNIKWLSDNPWAYIILEGHCDEVGAEDYNMFLGDLRARAIKAHLYERGVDPEHIIMVVSFGEKKPIDAAHTFEARQQNRRVEFKIR